MGWLIRGDRRYYYRSSRVAGRPTKTYFGSGSEAEDEAAAVERRKAEREERQREFASEADAYREGVARLEELCRLTDLLMKTHLVLAGFRQHDRGEWRRRRDATGHETPD